MEREHQLVAITMTDGTLSVMDFLTVGRGSVLPRGAHWLGEGWWQREPTKGAIERDLAAAHPQGGWASWRLAEPHEFDGMSRVYRASWRDVGRTIYHDMAHARQIHRERLREYRKPRFVELDGQWMRAFGRGSADEIAAIEAQRQALRDAPADPRIDAAQTVEDLKAITLG